MRLDYRFDPQRLRAALAQVADWFPLEGRGPDGLDALFRMLEQLDLERAGVWGERLSEEDLDLLCDQFPRAPSTRALLVVALILQHRRDVRAAQVLRLMLHRLPHKAELEFLQERWAAAHWDELSAGSSPWINRFMALTPLPTPTRFVIDGLRSGQLQAAELERDFPETTPLFQGLIEFLFTEGCAFLTQLPSERAGDEAQRYLERGDDLKVLNYLNHYPESRWRPEFLKALHQRKGAPDPKRNAFYKPLDTGRIWGLRIQMFEAELAETTLPVAKKILWHDWLHHCHEVRFEKERVLFYFAGLILMETADATHIFLVSEPKKPWKSFRLDHKWDENMRELLLAHQSWK